MGALWRGIVTERLKFRFTFVNHARLRADASVVLKADRATMVRDPHAGTKRLLTVSSEGVGTLPQD